MPHIGKAGYARPGGVSLIFLSSDPFLSERSLTKLGSECHSYLLSFFQRYGVLWEARLPWTGKKIKESE